MGLKFPELEKPQPLRNTQRDVQALAHSCMPGLRMDVPLLSELLPVREANNVLRL